MSAKRLPLSHGASHAPGGPDEIPGLGGGGDVVGDTASTPGNVVTMSGIDGKHVEDSGVAVADLLTSAAAAAAYQPKDSDLTAIAALTTQSYGRAFLELVNQAGLMALLLDADSTNKGIAKLGAAGGARAYTATTQTLSANGTMDADLEQLRVTASCAATLRAISTLTIGRPTVVVVESTSEIVVELIADAADKIEGATRAYLVATRGLYILTPAVANKWTLAAVRGRALWLHAAADLSTASGSSAWSISGTTWTDTSSASSSVAAAAGGLTATAKSTSSYYGAASADCAMARTPVSGLVDGWSRPMDPVRGRYWILTKWSRTTSVGGSSVIAYVAMGTATLAGTPRIGIRDETGGAVVDHITRDSATHTLTTIGTSTVSAGWMGFRWDGALLKVTGAVRSTSPSGNPGEASGWCPSTYELGDHAQHGQDYWGTQWRPDNLTNIHLAQTNTTTGSKATFTYFSVMCEIGDPS